MILFIDTGAFYALEDISDQHHFEAVAFQNIIADGSYQLITTNYILSETYTLLRMRLGHSKAVDFGNKIQNSNIITTIHYPEEKEQAAWKIFCKYHDKSFSYVDCTSFVVMKEKGITYAFAFDHHFQQAGFGLLPK